MTETPYRLNGGGITSKGMNPLAGANGNKGIHPLAGAWGNKGINPLVNAGGNKGINPLVNARVSLLLAAALSSALLLGFAACGKKDARVRIGHSGGYLSAAVYAARGSVDADVQTFRSSSDVAYALLSGALDAGFVEAEKLAAFAAIDGFDRLTAVGKVTYPYGATVVLRKGLDARLDELNGLTVAVAAPSCALLKEFAADAKRLDADISGIKFEHVVFDGMIPALEAGVIDAAVIKGSYSVAALQGEHSILYQNWEMKPGDECCPAVLNQAALVLLARRGRVDAVKPFVDALLSAQKLPPDSLRRAVAGSTVIPFEILEGQPVPEFSAADDELIAILVRGPHEHGDDHDDDQDEENDGNT